MTRCHRSTHPQRNSAPRQPTHPGRDPPLHPSNAPLSRRRLLASCLAALGLSPRWSGRSPRRQDRFRRLTQSVSVPLTEVAALWHPAWFDAWLPVDDSGAGDGREILLKGVLLRLPSGEGESGLHAFCLTCPHEICFVDYVEDTDWVPLNQHPKPDHPLLVCPCHTSVFDPMARGDRLAGPAPRGLFRFRLELTGDSVAITAVEEAVLRALGSTSSPPREGS